MSIDIANESGVAVSEVALAELARHVLDQMQIHPLAELSVLLVDEQAMADLHQRWMGEPDPTDVLAFPMDELRPPDHLRGTNAKAGGHEPAPEPGPGLLGDVVLCPQIAARQAQEDGHRVEDEVELLCIHGILHLLGYDHADAEDHATMFSLQEQLLASWRAAVGGRDGAPAGHAAAGNDTAGDEGAGDEAAGDDAARDDGPAARDGAAAEQRGGREGPE